MAAPIYQNDKFIVYTYEKTIRQGRTDHYQLRVRKPKDQYHEFGASLDIVVYENGECVVTVRCERTYSGLGITSWMMKYLLENHKLILIANPCPEHVNAEQHRAETTWFAQNGFLKDTKNNLLRDNRC